MIAARMGMMIPNIADNLTTKDPPVYVSTQSELEKLVDTMQGSDLLAVDTEFHSEKTYYAKLCLIQLATEDVSAIVDPLAIHDLSPLVSMFADENMVKIFHAGNQDIEILNRSCGTVPRPIFDTQVAAGLLGHPQQIGYGALVKAFCDVTLPKADSFTDWTRRPLSETQLKYAIDDVLYLPGIYRTMLERLESNGRLEWLADDFAQMADPDNYHVNPEDTWHKVKRVSSLTRKQLAVAQVVAAWRERMAQKRNLPRKWVLSDEMVIEISRRAPKTRQSLLEVRGIGEHLSERSIKELLADIDAALSRDPETWPKVSHRAHAQREATGVVDLMLALLHLRSQENGVACQIIATKEDLVRLSKGEGDGLPIMTGWRRKLVGNEMLSLLEGELDMRIVEGQLKVTKSLQD